MDDRITTELERATAELRAHLGSWEYAFAMGSSCHGGQDHPTHRAARERAARLRARVDALQGRLDR